MLTCKLKKGKPSGKQYRTICNALNEAIVSVLDPPSETQNDNAVVFQSVNDIPGTPVDCTFEYKRGMC